MRYTEFKTLSRLFEMAADVVDNLKLALADKIKTLPADDSTIKTLREIEDLLRDVNAGGRKGLIFKDLQTIDDPAVHAAQKDIARYIMSIDGTPEERNELFKLWRADNLVNKEQLLSGEDVTFAEVFNGYGTNPVITELVDTLMNVATLGHGKGEFALNVFSKTISKPTDGKGDLKIELKGKMLQVEVKTASETITIDPETQKEKRSTSSARFGDQEVRPAGGWDAAARDLNEFVRATGQHKSRKGFKMTVPGSGLSLASAIEFYQNVTSSDQREFSSKLEKVVQLIFGAVEGGRKKYVTRLNTNIKSIVDFIKEGDLSGAKQAYSNASFNYYMARKNDDGVLYVSLVNNTFVWYDSAESLTGKGLRLHADSIYLTGVNDPGRTAYPQIYVQPTTFGGNQATSNLSKIAKTKKAMADPNFGAAVSSWTADLASQRNITDPELQNKISMAVVNFLAGGLTTQEILPELEKSFPQLKVKVARTAQPKTTTQTAPVTATTQTVPVQQAAQVTQPAV
jgi:hypothetical protein